MSNLIRQATFVNWIGSLPKPTFVSRSNAHHVLGIAMLVFTILLCIFQPKLKAPTLLSDRSGASCACILGIVAGQTPVADVDSILRSYPDLFKNMRVVEIGNLLRVDGTGISLLLSRTANGIVDSIHAFPSGRNSLFLEDLGYLGQPDNQAANHYTWSNHLSVDTDVADSARVSHLTISAPGTDQ